MTQLKSSGMRLVSAVFFISTFLAGCGQDIPTPAPGNSESASSITLYHNGTVLTMASDEPSVAEALIEELLRRD